MEKVSRTYKAKTGAGCDGFHPRVPLDLTKETRGEIVEFLEKVEQSGKWPQVACTSMLFLIPKNITSERPLALMPTLIHWWDASRAIRGGEVAAEVPRCLGRYGWPKWRGPASS